MPGESRFGPPRDSLIPLDIPLGHHLQLEVPRGKNKSLGSHLKQLPPGGRGDKAEKLPLNCLILRIRSLRERNETQLLTAVKQITGAQTETPGYGRVTVGDTPEYHWDTGYDGIQGFSSHLKNRVSETSIPQGGQSPRGRPRTPPEPQRQFKQLKVYD